MSEWKAKRFWKDATVSLERDGYGVLLDGRPVRTPAKALLVLPTRALADAIAAEWDAQQGSIDPRSMPLTRSANAAIDKVAVQHGEVAQMIADYGDSDLLCYRAPAPAELVARQHEIWDPLLDWAANVLGARLGIASGVVHVPQEPVALDRLSQRVHAMDSFALAAFHDLVSLSGSLIIGFAATLDHLEIERLWQVSRLDEDWQIEQWGADEDAAALAETKRLAFLHAKRFHDLSRPSR
ncbi:ATPase [Seohaeicola saemankumensis]|uniref:ATP12 family chaperone protein n=1 Tax=Seohaeicola saemankumensis TaxID=481181 RepID=UPI001E3033C8|nr:ATP12 family protein [Seohaeicola saemankumensis]MCD1626278.1 ATPase [Seohaeicola saemankumensis]